MKTLILTNNWIYSFSFWYF